MRACWLLTAPRPCLRTAGDDARPFAIKSINILDPLNAKNNLGRSVGKANYLRVRKAFELSWVMLREIVNISDEELGARLVETKLFRFTNATVGSNAGPRDRHIHSAQ